MSRPRKELENIPFDGWDQLKALAVWATASYCAEQLGVSVDTIEKRLREKFDCTFTEYRDKVREPLRINLMKKQYDVAMQGNVSMLIWLGKQYLGQSEKSDIKQVTNSVEQIILSRKKNANEA